MIVAGLVAGGSGTRMKSTIPKQFLPLGGEPILYRTLRTFCLTEEVDAVLVGVPAEWIERTEELAKELREKERISKPVLVCSGGKSRLDTLVRLKETAESRLHAGKDDIFLTHDAVRPFVTEEMIRANIIAMDTAAACSTVIPATDTVLISMDGEQVYSVPKRSTMFLAQTPQTVRFGEFGQILESLSDAERAVTTDVCGIYRLRGIPVAMVPGSPENIKITGPLDLSVGETIIRLREAEQCRKEKENV